MKPILRRGLWEAKRLSAIAQSRVSGRERDVVFVVGCGRSGTTLLGRLFSRHPGVHYFNEPRDRWTAMDTRTDDIGLYDGTGARLWLDAGDVTARCRRRARLINAPLSAIASDATTIVEKSPSNVFRLNWLRALFPHCRFVHIIRDGRDVVRSIAAIAAANQYRIAPSRARNQWWGNRELKKQLVFDLAQWPTGGASRVRGDREVDGDRTAAALEWILSVEAGLDYESRFPQSVRTIRYEALLADCSGQMSRLLDWCGLPAEDAPSLCAMVTPRPPSGEPFEYDRLAPNVACRFRDLLQKLGYTDRHVAEAEPDSGPELERASAIR